MKITIVGGGIVGLATAISLARAGLRATIYEAAPELRPLGVGINMLPHAVRELTELGLLDDVRALGIEMEDLVYRMVDGRPVWHEPRGLKAGYAWPQVAVHRGNFHMLLLNRVRELLGPESVRLGRPLESLTQQGGATRLAFRNLASGEAEIIDDADVVIGADGIHSVVRRAFYPDEGRPVWNGVSLFRSTTQIPLADFAPRLLWAGHATQKFVAYPIAVDRERGTVTLNWICDLKTGAAGAVPNENWNQQAERQPLIDRYRDWRWDDVDVPAIVTASGPIFEYPMVDRDPLPRWSFGNVTLAGDAAHPMYPIGSNGATQGIIDARVLTWHLGHARDPIGALQAYEAERLAATSQIVLGNRKEGPDVVLDLAHNRAGASDADLDALLPHQERAAIASSYKHLAGFDPASLNARRSYSVEALQTA